MVLVLNFSLYAMQHSSMDVVFIRIQVYILALSCVVSHICRLINRSVYRAITFCLCFQT